MYAGIFVNKVQNPQLWAEWTIINEMNGIDVNIANQGVGGRGRLVVSSVVVVASTADSIQARSSTEIFSDSEGELHPNMNQKIAQTPPATPEK